MERRWRRRGSREGSSDPAYKAGFGKYLSAVGAAYRSLSLRGRLICFLEAACITAVLSYVFYRSWLGAFAFPMAALLCLWQGAGKQERERKVQLSKQFTDTILAVSGSLQSGYSIENAFLEAEKEICTLHGKNSLMAAELTKIRHGMGNRIPLEQQLLGFGNRCQIEEIRDFTEVFAIIKRSGGNLREMIRRTADLTGQRLEVEQEIAQMLSSRQFEMKIMIGVPFVMYGYVQLTSPGFFDVLYHNPAGICVMTACLAVYLAAVWLSWNIMNIRV